MGVLLNARLKLFVFKTSRSGSIKRISSIGGKLYVRVDFDENSLELVGKKDIGSAYPLFLEDFGKAADQIPLCSF